MSAMGFGGLWCSLLAVVGLACGDEAGIDHISLDDLTCESAVDGAWESADWSCEWLEFEAGRTKVVEHDLGRVPTRVVGYVSFQRNGAAAVVAVGDMMRIEAVDARHVEVRNDEGAHFYVRLVLD